MTLTGKSFALAVAALVLCVQASSSPAQSRSEPITIVSHVDIKPDAYMPRAEENSWKLFRAETAATEQEPGLVSYVVLQEIGSPNHFTIIETWHDPKAYQMHEGADHTVRFRHEIQPYLGSPFDARIHHVFP